MNKIGNQASQATTCSRKILYPDKITALLAAAQINYDNNGKRASSKLKQRGVRRLRKYSQATQTPYLCPICRNYHLTSGYERRWDVEQQIEPTGQGGPGEGVFEK